MNYAIVTDASVQYLSGIASIDETEGILTIKSLDLFSGPHENEVWKSEFAKSIFERPIAFHNLKFDGQMWYGIWINDYERQRLVEMFSVLPSYVRFLELGELPK